MKKQTLRESLKLLIAFTFIFQYSISSSQNLVQNGSFELISNQIPVPPGFSTLGVGTPPNLLTNWTHSGTVDIHHFSHHNMGVPTGGGVHHIDVNVTGEVSQTINNLTPGVMYILRFHTSVHDLMTCMGTSDVRIEIGSLNTTLQLTSADKAWTQRTYTFVANSASETLSFTSDGSCYSQGGVLIDLVEILNNCNPECQDEDWLEEGTTSAPDSHLDNMYRIGNAGIGTTTPTWNFKLTVDNRDGVQGNNNGRNAIHALAMQDNCTYGYGIMVGTNASGGTKAVAVQGNGNDNAIIYGNGMGWFSNRVTIGGPATGDVCTPTPTGGPILVVNGTGTINGVNITSDQRFKKNIAEIENSHSIIEKLNPVTYEYRNDEFSERNFEQNKTYGFIAQEIKEVLPEIVRKEQDGYYSVNYIAIIPVLTQAIKEQQETIKKLEEKVNLLADASNQKGAFDKETPIQKVGVNKQPVLFQNNPNPLNNVTFIEYFLPQTTQSAFVKVIDNTGKLVKAFPIELTGYGQLELDCTNLQSGTYHYSLIVDKQVVDTKTMLVAKN